MNAGFPTSIQVEDLAVASSGGCVHASTNLGVFDMATRVGSCAPPFPVTGPLLSVGLTVSRHTISPGDSAQVSISIANGGPTVFRDLYFLLVLPPALSLSLGCPAGDGVAFLGSAFAPAIRCTTTAPPQTFPPLLSNVAIQGGLPATTIAGFYSFVWPEAVPSGLYEWIIFATPPGAFADGNVGPTDISAYGGDRFLALP